MEVRLVVERGARNGRTFWMHDPEMVVGRKKGCGLRIPSAAVSREHCRLQVFEGILTVEDLGSVNGTSLNGEAVTERQAVRPGDQLKVGPVTFVVEYQLDQAALDRLARWESQRANPRGDFDFNSEDPPVLALEDDPALPLLMDDPNADVDVPVVEEEALVELELANDLPLELPADGQLRDLLSQMEEPEDKT
ncbi:MAG: FHA domain-containing protein [Planctomycetes bacterium]|nr:FHA domain-containing protein [Planctomycetota bacterium]